MYIKWIACPFDSTKNNTKEHVPRSVAEVAVAYKQAVIEPRPNYGTSEWIAERQAADSGRSPNFGDAASTVQGVEWGIRKKDEGSPWSKNVIVKRSGAEKTFFTSPPPDCPPSIAAQLRQLNGTVELDPDSVRERVVQEQYRHETQKEKDKVGVLGMIFGTGSGQ